MTHLLVDPALVRDDATAISKIVQITQGRGASGNSQQINSALAHPPGNNFSVEGLEEWIMKGMPFVAVSPRLYVQFLEGLKPQESCFDCIRPFAP